MSVPGGVRDTVNGIREKLRGKIGETRVKRYWPGKAPEWAKEKEGEEEGDVGLTRTASLEPSEAGFGVGKGGDDARLRRVGKVKIDNREEVIADHKRIRQAEIVSTMEEESRRQEGVEEYEEDEEERLGIRENSLRMQQEDVLPLEDEEDEEVEETDSEEESRGVINMIKPVFGPKSGRETVAERERVEAKERAVKEQERRRMEEKKVETKQIVVELIREDKEIEKNIQLDPNIGDVDTDDEINEGDEYEAWKVRDILRIKRDREDRDAVLKEKEEIERVRNMSEEERREWERRNPKRAKSSKRKWKFMQKYYHKGAFFQDDSAVGDDFSAPTGDDKLDKSILPKVMQVKHFGRSGRTKWTHLVDEDTTDWNNPWTCTDSLRAKYNAKMAGMIAPIEKPKGSKKLKDWESK